MLLILVIYLTVNVGDDRIRIFRPVLTNSILLDLLHEITHTFQNFNQSISRQLLQHKLLNVSTLIWVINRTLLAPIGRGLVMLNTFIVLVLKDFLGVLVGDHIKHLLLKCN